MRTRESRTAHEVDGPRARDVEAPAGIARGAAPPRTGDAASRSRRRADVGAHGGRRRDPEGRRHRPRGRSRIVSRRGDRRPTCTPGGCPPGLPVTVKVNDDVLEGRVAAVLPTIQNGAITLHVALTDPSSPLLRSNLRVDVGIVTARKPRVVRIKRGPFATGEGVQQVFVVRGDRAVRTPVELGLGELRPLRGRAGARPRRRGRHFGYERLHPTEGSEDSMTSATAALGREEPFAGHTTTAALHAVRPAAATRGHPARRDREGVSDRAHRDGRPVRHRPRGRAPASSSRSWGRPAAARARC